MFSGYQVRIDPWEVDYGVQSPIAASPDGEALADTIDHEVELPDGDWTALAGTAPDRSSASASDFGGPLPPGGRVRFIDGVRRLEARIHVRRGDTLIYGGFGSYAVGAVELAEGHAELGDVRVFRTAVLGSGEILPESVVIRDGLVYRAESTDSVEVDGPLEHIQKSMRLAEAGLARDLTGPDRTAGEPTGLTIVDGPLRFAPEGAGKRSGRAIPVAVGYIKRVHQLYLPDRFLPLLASLPSGARTPLFLIRSAKGEFSRYSWFQRLAAPGPGATDLHGIVRLEVSTDVGLEAARSVAGELAGWLPYTAPTRSRDPRSPQNLMPIGALESRLRAALGDAILVRRWIETVVAKEAEALV